jgi:hypothetical protein
LKTLLKSCVLALLLGSVSFAENLTGTVTNATSDKPSAGDDVILLKLAQGMEEATRTKSDSKGRFSLTLDDASAPHLVRVVHQGVTYHRMAPPGSTSVEVQVYDVAKKIEGVSITADVMRFQAQGDQLQGVRLFAVDNKSTPPRTQMNDKSFEFYLPEGAVVDAGETQTAGGNPLNLAPVPQSEKGRYAFIFPLRPGETTMQVTFHVPYSGELSIDPRPLYPAQHFVVLLPKTMQFAGAQGSAYKDMKSPKEPDTGVEVASNTQVGDPLGFKISGTGVLAESAGGGGDGGGGEGGEGGAPQGRDSVPGGGLGPPIDAPRPLQKYTWLILVLFAVALVAGAVITAWRPAAASAPAGQPVAMPVASVAKPSGGSTMLLDALKEEMFQLEMEHKQGSIPQEEYTKAKAALDQTLERALKRKPQA